MPMYSVRVLHILLIVQSRCCRKPSVSCRLFYRHVAEKVACYSFLGVQFSQEEYTVRSVLLCCVFVLFCFLLGWRSWYALP